MRVCVCVCVCVCGLWKGGVQSGPGRAGWPVCETHVVVSIVVSSRAGLGNLIWKGTGTGEQVEEIPLCVCACGDLSVEIPLLTIVLAMKEEREYVQEMPLWRRGRKEDNEDDEDDDDEKAELERKQRDNEKQ